MKIEPLMQMFLRLHPHLDREEARRKGRAFRDMLTQLPGRWRVNLEMLVAAYLDDVEGHPNLSPEQALEQATALRRELQRISRRTNQAAFEERCLPMGLSVPDEVEHED